MATYESEITDFLRQLKQQRPHLEEEQRKGRAIWWDKDGADPDQTRRLQESRVPQQAYPYQTKT
jgi:hypothetical protein